MRRSRPRPDRVGVAVIVPAVAVALVATACSSSISSGPPPTTQIIATPSTRGPASAGCGTVGGSGSQGGRETAPPGDIPDTQPYVSFSPLSSDYTIKVPGGWARSSSGSTTSFTDKLNAIRVELVPAPAPATSASAQTSEVPSLQAHSSCPSGIRVTTVSRNAGQAVLITYQSDSAPDPVTGKIYRDDVERYEFWKSGTEAVVTVSAPVGSDNVDPWRIVTNSFAWTR